jgi:hypothetical protein
MHRLPPPVAHWVAPPMSHPWLAITIIILAAFIVVLILQMLRARV